VANLNKAIKIILLKLLERMWIQQKSGTLRCRAKTNVIKTIRNLALHRDGHHLRPGGRRGLPVEGHENGGRPAARQGVCESTS